MSTNTRIKLFDVLGQTGGLKLNPAQARQEMARKYVYVNYEHIHPVKKKYMKYT